MEMKQKRVELSPTIWLGFLLFFTTSAGWSAYLQFQVHQIGQKIATEEQTLKALNLHMPVSFA